PLLFQCVGRGGSGRIGEDEAGHWQRAVAERVAVDARRAEAELHCAESAVVSELVVAASALDHGRHLGAEARLCLRTLAIRGGAVGHRVDGVELTQGRVEAAVLIEVLEAVRHAIAVGVGLAWVAADTAAIVAVDLDEVREAVAVGVGLGRIGAAVAGVVELRTGACRQLLALVAVDQAVGVTVGDAGIGLAFVLYAIGVDILTTIGEAVVVGVRTHRVGFAELGLILAVGVAVFDAVGQSVVVGVVAVGI